MCTIELWPGANAAVRRSGEPPDFVPATFAPNYASFVSDDVDGIAVLRTSPVDIMAGIGPSGSTLSQLYKTMYLEPGDV